MLHQAIHNRIHIDFETRSIVDLIKCGSTMYAQHASTNPLMLAWCDREGDHLYDFMSNPDLASSVYPARKFDDPSLNSYKPRIPERIAMAIEEDCVFVAHNARFEQDCWYWLLHKRWGWPMPRRWSCTAARARYWGLRHALEFTGQDLKLNIQKEAEGGKQFIDEFTKPRKYKGPKYKGNIVQLWSEPHENSLGWENGKHYCLVDAQVERGIDCILPDLPPFEQAVWDLDFKINTHGIPIDIENVQKAIHFSEHYTEMAVARFNAITSLNPTQRDRVLEYLNQRDEMDTLANLQSKTLRRIVLEDLPSDLRDVITIRLDASRASVKKLDAMVNNTSEDGFARGLFFYYGAHTGRQSAKRIQPHNFIRGSAAMQEMTFDYFDSGCWEAGVGRNGMPEWLNVADVFFPRPLKSLAQSMRGFIKAPPGKKIISGDYAQIEARVLAWLACEMKQLQDFANGEDPYCRLASVMYNRPYADYFIPGTKKVKPDPQIQYERQCAKSAVLGAGFQLAGPGFQQYCDNLDIFLTLEEATRIIKVYRDSVPGISDFRTGLWSRVNWCAIKAVQMEGEVVTLFGTEVTFHVHRYDELRWWLLMTLPSGRHIAYYKPYVEQGDWGRPQLFFRTSINGGRTPRDEDTHGGRITENIVQGIARDICMIGASNADAAGYDIFGTIHDEILGLVDENRYESLRPLKECLLDLPEWTRGLPLNAEVKVLDRYTK